MSFRKAGPTARRIVAVDAGIVESLTWDRAPAILLAAWLRGGSAFANREVSTPKGVVVLNEGQTWGSLISAQEDIFATVGVRYSYGTLRNAARVLQQKKVIVRRHDPLPATRGRYGSVYTLSDALITPEKPVPVTTEFRHRYYGDPNEFRYASCVQGVLATGRARRRVEDADAFVERITDNGLNIPAFAQIGRWREGEVGDPTAPVFVPWVTIDIDREVLEDAFYDTREMLTRIAAAGFDRESVLVSFSGSKGFHVQIPANLLGSPIFADTEAAKIVLDELTARLCWGFQIDPAVNNPTQLIRVTGSRHNKTGLYKVTFRQNDFEYLDFEQIMYAAEDARGADFPFVDPREVVQMEAEVHDFFDAVSIDAESRYTAVRERYTAAGKAGDTIRRILLGIAEGESWHLHHEGRNKAAFILACFLLEDRETGDPDIDALPGPSDKLDFWNRRNRPPLPSKELRSVYRSASRRVGAN